MSKNKTIKIFLIVILVLLLPTGCNNEVNFGKADKVVGSFIAAQVQGNKETVNSVISQELKKSFMKENLYLQERYGLDKPNLATINIFELQSNGEQKIIAANYVVEDQEEKLNITSLFLLEIKGDRWSIQSVEEITLHKSLES